MLRSMKGDPMKLVKSAFILAILSSVGLGQEISTKELIRQMFKNVIEEKNPDESVYPKYFAQDYVQNVDGKTLDYPAFVRHMKALKREMKKLTVSFRYM